MMTDRFFLRIMIVILSFWSTPAKSQNILKEVSDSIGVRYEPDVFTLGNGLSLVDFNQDGLDDITIGTPAGEPIQFFINEGGTFSKTPSLVANINDQKQILWVDFDNDGDKDLFVAVFDGISRLYRNNGAMILEDITAQIGLPMEDRRSYGATWIDFNRDGWLDLYFTYRVQNVTLGKHENILMLNADGKELINISEAANAKDFGKIPFMPVGLHLNDDRWPDIYLANDRNSGNAVLQNSPEVIFESLADEENGAFAISGMGIAVGDVNRDGLSDLYVTNIATGNLFLQNISNADEILFDEISQINGTAFNEISWGANFLDYDHDADLDLYVSGSSLGAQFKSSMLYEHKFDFFAEITEGREADTLRSYSNAIGDIDNDGDIDIVVQNAFPGKVQVWENKIGSELNWVKLNLQGVKSNIDGYGSKIKVWADDQYQSSQSICGVSFLGQNSNTIHFGINNATLVDSIKVTWPTGHTDTWFDLTPNTTHSLIEGATTGGIIEMDINTSSDQGLAQNELIPIVIYPNPSEEFINLISEMPIKRIVITDMIGNKVRDVMEPQESKIDIKNLLDGLYIINIFDYNNSRYLAKWIKS